MNDSDRYHLDYRLDTLSPAKDAGDPLLLEPTLSWALICPDFSERLMVNPTWEPWKEKKINQI